LLAGEVLEGDFFAFVGLEAKDGGFGADFEHGTFLALTLECNRKRERTA